MSKQDIEKRLGFAAQGVKVEMAFPSASTASNRTQDLLRSELSRIAGEGYIQYKGRSKINTLKSKSDFLQMISDLRSHLAPLQKKWVSKSEQEQDAAGSLETSSALNTISGALKKLDQLTTMANGVTTAARPSAKKASTDFDLEEACWEGYEAVGTKKKDGKTVPNCVPKKKAARPGVKAKFDQAKSFLNQVSSGFNIESLKESLVGAKEVARFAPQYKALGQKLVDGINMVMSAVKQMKAESMKASRPSAKEKMSKATDALAFIKSSIESGKTVYIQTPRGATKVTPKTYAKFEALGRPLFKIGTDGALLMSSGSSYVRLTMGEDEMLVRVSAMSRLGAKGKFVRIVTTTQGRYTTNLDKNTRALIEGGKGYVMVDPAQYITPKRVRVQGTKGEIEVRAVLDGKEIVGVSAKLVSSRPGVKATFAEFNVGDKVVYVPDSRHIDAYGRIIKIENGIAIIASAEGNVKAKLSDLELVKKGSVEDLRRLGMKGFARPGVKAEFYASPEHLPMILAKTRKMHEDSKKAAEKYLQSGSVANQGGAAGLANSMVNSLERDLKNDLYRLTQSRNPVHKKAAKEAYAEIKAMADWWYSQYKKWTAARPGVKAKAKA